MKKIACCLLLLLLTSCAPLGDRSPVEFAVDALSIEPCSMEVGGRMQAGLRFKLAYSYLFPPQSTDAVEVSVALSFPEYVAKLAGYEQTGTATITLTPSKYDEHIQSELQFEVFPHDLPEDAISNIIEANEAFYAEVSYLDVTSQETVFCGP